MREDIERLAPNGSVAWGTSAVAKTAALELEQMVTADEPVEAICRVIWGKKTKWDILALTDRRLILIGKGVFKTEVEDFALSKVSVISVNKTFMSGAIVFKIGSAERSVKPYDPPAADALVARARQLIFQTTVPVSAPSASPPTAADPVAQLAQLGKLRDAGVLTEAEFAAKKAELLRRI